MTDKNLEKAVLTWLDLTFSKEESISNLNDLLFQENIHRILQNESYNKSIPQKHKLPRFRKPQKPCHINLHIL